jgi:hypothetical protein
MSKSIRKTILSRSREYPIQRFERAEGFFDDDDGIWVDAPESKTTVKVHLQPIVDKLNDGVPSQRQEISWHGWAVDIPGNKVSNKDIITVDDGLFTVSNMVHWPGDYREFDLTRSGEADNIDDT